MTLTEIIDYIEAEWPIIVDAQACARWIASERHGQRAQSLDHLLSFWARHEHD